MTNEEKLAKKVADLEKQLTDTRKQRDDAIVKHEIQSAAQRHGVISPDVFSPIIGRCEVKDGKVYRLADDGTKVPLNKHIMDLKSDPRNANLFSDTLTAYREKLAGGTRPASRLSTAEYMRQRAADPTKLGLRAPYKKPAALQQGPEGQGQGQGPEEPDGPEGQGGVLVPG